MGHSGWLPFRYISGTDFLLAGRHTTHSSHQFFPSNSRLTWQSNMNVELSKETLIYLITHVFMPPRLPGGDDRTLEHDVALYSAVIDAMESFEEMLNKQQLEVWKPIVNMLNNLRTLQGPVKIEAATLLNLFATIKEGESLVVPTRAQNACVIIRFAAKFTTFEVFEVDPPNDKIMGTVGKVVRTFPNKVIEIPSSTFSNPYFQNELASFLARMDADALETAPKTRKAGEDVKETRDTTDSHYITSFFFAILRGLPGSKVADVLSVRKRIENDIVFENAELPWRRSPLWLVIRVALHTTVYSLTGSSHLYKFFMVHFMCRLLHHATKRDISSPLLHCMKVKVARRLCKLGDEISDAFANKVLAMIEAASTLMESRWKEVQEDNPQSLWDPQSLDILGDTRLSLTNSMEYIRNALSRADPPETLTDFNPSEHARLPNTASSPSFASKGDDIHAALKKDRAIALADIELSVQNHLDAWMEQNRREESTSSIICSCITEYVAAAQAEYQKNPEDLSIMMLTVFDLWVALDKVAMTHHSMLRDYSPEVPSSILNPLLLRTASSIERYQRIQEYILERHRNSRGYSIFDEFVTKNSFSIRYFNDSIELQELKEQIELDAEYKKQCKLRELDNEIKRRRTYLDTAQRLSHTYGINRWGSSYHDHGCEKCRNENLARDMKIAIHEWPLPSNEILAKRAVFELRVPTVFRQWRSSTYMILYDLCRPDPPETCEESEGLLEDYSELSKYVGNTDRITLASSTKSFIRSHYSRVLVAQATREDVARQNGLTFALYDTKKKRWANRSSFEDCEIDALCTQQIPSQSPYRNLQKFVDGTSHSPNAVIADQSSAPPELNLHEHIAFGTLRSGANIQWINILRELHAQTLSLDKREIQILLLQAAWQIGEYSSGQCRWHQDLRDIDFGHTLLSEIENILTNIEENWLHLISLETLSRIVTRLLNSATNLDEDVRLVSRALHVLRRARNIAYRWVSELREKLRAAEDDSTTHDLQPLLCTAALVCRATYDVDNVHIDALLEVPKDVATFLECMIYAHDNTPEKVPASHLKDLISRDRRLSHRTNNIISDRVKSDRACLDLTIGELWDEYSLGSLWHPLTEPSERWFTAKAGEGSRDVHINLLDGTLLIDGKPLNRLPRHITRHGTYQRLFGQKIFEVGPSNRPKMEFCTRYTYPPGEFLIHFGMVGEELVIEAATKDLSKVYQLIPHTVLAEDFPHFLVSDYFHWLHLAGKIPSEAHDAFIEFRPLETPWKNSDQNWHLTSSSTGEFYLVKRFKNEQLKRLVDVRSPSFGMIAERLEVFESRKYMMMTIDVFAGHRVSLELPRHRLTFGLNEDQELESCDLRGMVLDDAYSGCMFGLRSQLVLRPKNLLLLHLPRARCVLIPYGDVRYQSTEHHVKVTIHTSDDDRHVRHFKYNIDTNLGYLIAQSLEADYYKIYLHAITSHCLPDPLTGRTGTEEALAELSSAKCRSFQLLGIPERELLFLIAGLAVARDWYPKHLMVMQVVQWRDSLSMLSQHPDFFTISRDILDYATKLAVFSPDEDITYDFPTSQNLALNNHLRDRAFMRISRLFNFECLKFEQAASHDETYSLTDDSVHHTATSPDTTVMTSALVQTWSKDLDTVPDLWAKLSTANHLLCGTSSLMYNPSMLHPSISKLFISIYDACTWKDRDDDEKRFALTFSLGAIAYSSPGHDLLSFIPTFLAFATIPQFKDLHIPKLPSWVEFELARGTTPNREKLDSWTMEAAKDLDETPAVRLNRWSREDESEFLRRRKNTFDEGCQSEVRRIVDQFIFQWSEHPEHVNRPGSTYDYIEVSQDYMDVVHDHFKHWHMNRCLWRFVVEVQHVLDLYRKSHQPFESLNGALEVSSFSPQVHYSSERPQSMYSVSLQDLVKRLTHITIASSHVTPPKLEVVHDTPSTAALAHLIQQFRCHHIKFRELYADSLEKSRRILDEEVLESLLDFLKATALNFNDLFQHFQSILAPSSLQEKIISASGNWPRITKRTLFQLLSHTASRSANTVDISAWTRPLVILGQRLLRLQQAQRCIGWFARMSIEELRKELQNGSTESDEVFKDPDWLLIQIESNVMARPLQENIALEMTSPTSQDNTLLQLNMGEGKTSVIVPLVAVRLADKDKLVRVIVLKPLKNQMFNGLVSRLGGLVNRRIFYIPFSRDVPITTQNLDCLAHLLDLCRREGGILLAQPEHILSLKLKSIDMMLEPEADNTIIAKLRQQQSWLRIYARDVLDESDEILSIEYQLVYTNGHQTSMEHHPSRWLLIQHVLGLVKKYATTWYEKSRPGIEIRNSSGNGSSFPLIRILDDAPWEHLVAEIAHELVYGQKSDFRLCSEETRIQVVLYIKNLNVDTRNTMDTERIRSLLNTSLWMTLLLYRGLLAHAILKFCLKQKRWRVDYGLDLARTLLAVPFKAKDVPSPRADFGHPDVALVLTCLSYYYEGLSDNQISLCFELLFNLDNPVIEYENWTRNNNAVPEGLRSLTGVNWADVQQRREYLIPLFRKSHPVIDFYLSSVVFPKEAKQFPSKLSTSAWDLSERTNHVKTGFSGTNDNQYLLPTTIHQRDHVNQLTGSTNAKVMTYLLQPENNFYYTYGSTREPLTGRQFLKFLTQQRPEVRVLLDVGAQMLDMRNDELVRHWLPLCHSGVQAAVFFNEANDLYIMTRDGNTTPFSSSPFNERLDACVVYLDDAHTRGTDLKLPSETRAAVTLGPKITKDRLMQGCMRMRKLGHGQSVIFLAPPDIDKRIRSAVSKNQCDHVTSSDVLFWAMSETCDRIAHFIGYWAHQGVSYMKRKETNYILDARNDLSTHDIEALRDAWIEPEARSLEEMYAAKAIITKATLPESLNVQELGHRLSQFSLDLDFNSLMEEEQERELNHEKEEQRQIERPPPAEPAQHSVHPNLRRLIDDGKLIHSPAFVSPLSTMEYLDSQSASWSPRLLATTDFSRTIVGHQNDREHLRPVNWILSVHSYQGSQALTLVILSPFEVNELMSNIRSSRHVHLHVYTPRTIQSMRTVEDLRFYCIPSLYTSWNPPLPSDTAQLNLWAGQLYLRDHESYRILCQTIGIVSSTEGLRDGAYDSDGFVVDAGYREEMGLDCRFERSPVQFLKALFGLRRKGMDYRLTHVGRILYGKALTDDDFGQSNV